MNRTVLCGTFLLAACTGLPKGTSAELSEQQIITGADARIEKHRKADAVISVVDAAGKAVPGAKVAVEQTRHAFLFGSNIFKWGKLPDEAMEAAYRKRFAELLNYATLPFYWWSYEPQRGRPAHAHTQQVARWCKQQRIATKGHPLAWNHSEPSWLGDDANEIRRLQMARIEDCVRHFSGPGLIERWDVVNEATHFDRAGCLKQAPKMTAMWRQVGQVEFTRQCFRHARKAAPNATLLINDYRTDPKYEKLIEGLVDDGGKPVYDVIGIQSHMHSGVWPTATIWEVCQRFARFGTPLHFTETTILSGERRRWGASEADWHTTPEGEKQQARDVVRFYTVLFSHPAVEAITWWDFSDLHAWRRAPAGFLRKDMTPKPAYDELKKLIKGKWWTRQTLETDRDGRASLRGFLGDYRVSVTAGGKTIARDLVLEKGKQNAWQIAIPVKTVR